MVDGLWLVNLWYARVIPRVQPREEMHLLGEMVTRVLMLRWRIYTYMHDSWLRLLETYLDFLTQ